MVFGWFPWFFKVVSWFFMVFGGFLWFFKKTRPKPAYGRQGLAGSWGQDTGDRSNQPGTIIDNENPPGNLEKPWKPTKNHETTLKNHGNQPKTMKSHKTTLKNHGNQPKTVKNQSGTIKTNLELYRVVMGGSGGYRRLPGGSAHFS